MVLPPCCLRNSPTSCPMYSGPSEVSMGGRWRRLDVQLLPDGLYVG